MPVCSSISNERSGLAQELEVYVDLPPRNVDPANRVPDQGDEQIGGAVAARDLEHFARGQCQQPPDPPDLARAVDDAAGLEIVRPPLILLESRRGVARREDVEAP